MTARSLGGRLAAALAGVLLVLAGCSLPVDDEARPVDVSKLPPLLAAPPVSSAPGGSTTSTTPGPGSSSTPYSVWFIAGEGLDRATRWLELASSYTDVLGELAAGPTAEEIEDHSWRSALTPETVLGVALSGGVATVDLDPGFSETVAIDQMLAIGQMVLTLTGYPGIGQLRLTIAGEPIQIPLPDGSQVERAVSREDFDELGAPD